MNAKEIKALSGAKSLWTGIQVLYKQLENRTWEINGRPCSVAGFDYKKDRLHFTSTWSLPEGGCGHRRVCTTLKEALDNKDGIIRKYLILH